MRKATGNHLISINSLVHPAIQTKKMPRTRLRTEYNKYMLFTIMLLYYSIYIYSNTSLLYYVLVLKRIKTCLHTSHYFVTICYYVKDYIVIPY